MYLPLLTYLKNKPTDLRSQTLNVVFEICLFSPFQVWCTVALEEDTVHISLQLMVTYSYHSVLPFESNDIKNNSIEN